MIQWINEWGVICNKGWDSSDATIYCKTYPEYGYGGVDISSLSVVRIIILFCEISRFFNLKFRFLLHPAIGCSVRLEFQHIIHGKLMPTECGGQRVSLVV